MKLIDKMAAQAETHYCPADRRYRVVLDPAEAFPDDPGNGTVAMVYGPREACATFGCASDTGELDCGAQELPPAVVRWLEEITDYVDDFTNAAFDAARVQGGAA